MATLTLGQVVTAVIVMIVIGLSFGIIKGMSMNDIFSAIGILEEENIGKTNIPTSSKYITLTNISPKEIAEEGGIFPKDENDWVGNDNIQLKDVDEIELRFDKKIKLTDEEQNAWIIVNRLEDITIGNDILKFDKNKNAWIYEGKGEFSQKDVITLLLDKADLKTGQHSYNELKGWQLNFKGSVRNQKTLDCIHVYESKKRLKFNPNKKMEWGNKIDQELFTFIEEKTVTIRGFKEGGFWNDYFYMIRFDDCFKGESLGDTEVSLNPQSGIVKFSMK
jgi:hypothetical protein